jgi:GT2 family glycosyltransferase
MSGPEPGQPGPGELVPQVGCVVLSMGDRPVELAKALDSVRNQLGVTVQVLVVGNGWVPRDLPQGVCSIALDTNVGVAEGRNVGARTVAGEYVLFLDDDAELGDADSLATMCQVLDTRQELATVQPRIEALGGGVAATRWVPRLRGLGRSRPGVVPGLWEGVLLVRRDAFGRVGGWGSCYFYGHEGIELAWRLIDDGWKLWYAADLVAWHPVGIVNRHPDFVRQLARNRVWVARRNLPIPLAALYLITWASIGVVRTRGRAKNLVTGYAAGFSQDCGERRPISWRTGWELTRLGRPPVI